MKVTPFSVSLSALLALTDAAYAQAPPTSATPAAETATPAPSPNAPNAANTNCAPHDTAAPKGTTTGQSREPLGDKLAKSDGVLCPPSNLDPEIRAPTPEGGKMPVIPPPGSPGGDPTVRPK